MSRERITHKISNITFIGTSFPYPASQLRLFEIKDHYSIFNFEDITRFRISIKHSILSQYFEIFFQFRLENRNISFRSCIKVDIVKALFKDLRENQSRRSVMDCLSIELRDKGSLKRLQMMMHTFFYFELIIQIKLSLFQDNSRR